MRTELGVLNREQNVTSDYYVVGNVIYLRYAEVMPGLPDHSMFEETTLRGIYVIKDQD
jgi:hypothetical protein